MISPEEEKEMEAYEAYLATFPTQTAMTEAQQRAYDQSQVMLAFSQGKKVQCHIKDAHDSWCTVSPTYTAWEFDKLVFRIAPEPQEVWLWLGGKREDKIFDWLGCCEQDMKDQGYTKKLFREVLDSPGS